MLSRHRLLILILVLTVIGTPAAVLRALCIDKSCKNESAAGQVAAVPFCPLPKDLRAKIEAGFRPGRSPDVFAVTKTPAIWGDVGPPDEGAAPLWPARDPPPDLRVPLVFAGTGVAKNASIPQGTGLDDIAPTLARMIGFSRGHPELRAGQEIPRLAGGKTPQLILEVAWKGVGEAKLRADKQAWPFLRTLMRQGAGTLQATTGSLPVDSTAALTTIGTGALPSQHGITGTLIRDKNGDLVRAWSDRAPISVLATLGDDLVQRHAGSRLGVVEADDIDQGIAGGNWYIGERPPDLDVARGAAAVAAARRMLDSGYGTDSVPDILAVTLQGSVAQMDAQLQQIVEAADESSGGSFVAVVAGTGSASRPQGETTAASQVVGQLERRLRTPGIVEAAIPGGLFVDQAVSANEGVPAGRIVDALASVRDPRGATIMDEAFPAFSISFARYC